MLGGIVTVKKVGIATIIYIIYIIYILCIKYTKEASLKKKVILASILMALALGYVLFYAFYARINPIIGLPSGTLNKPLYVIINVILAMSAIAINTKYVNKRYGALITLILVYAILMIEGIYVTDASTATVADSVGADAVDATDGYTLKLIGEDKLRNFYESTGSSWNWYYYIALSCIPLILMLINKKKESLLSYVVILLIPTITWVGGYVSSGDENDAILPTDLYWNIMKGSKGNWEQYEASDIIRTVTRSLLFIIILLIACYVIAKKFKMNILKTLSGCIVFVLLLFPLLSKLIIHECVIDNSMVDRYYSLKEIIGLQLSSPFEQGILKEFGGLLVQLISLLILTTLYFLK